MHYIWHNALLEEYITLTLVTKMPFMGDHIFLCLGEILIIQKGRLVKTCSFLFKQVLKKQLILDNFLYLGELDHSKNLSILTFACCYLSK